MKPSISMEALYAPIPCEGFSIVPVMGRMDPDLGAEIEALWARHRILPAGADSQRRLQQVVCIARDPEGVLASVCTAYRVKHQGKLYFAYRLFIRPHNGVPSLKVEITRVAREFLRDLPMPNKPNGLYLVLENPKLRRDEVTQALIFKGYRRAGLDAQGRDVWIFDF